MRVRTSVCAAVVGLVALGGCSDAGSAPARGVASDPASAGPPTAISDASDPAAETTVVERVIPADFPLASGWPRRAGEPSYPGLEGPSRELPPFKFSACHRSFEELPYLDRLTAHWTDIEDFRGRQLTLYANRHDASSATDRLTALFRSCKIGPLRDDRFRTEYEVLPADAGDCAWAILQRDIYEGSESPFGSTTLIVRVGAAVLVEDHGGHAGYPSGDGRADVATMVDEASHAIAAMARLSP